MDVEQRLNETTIGQTLYSQYQKLLDNKRETMKGLAERGQKGTGSENGKGATGRIPKDRGTDNGREGNSKETTRAADFPLLCQETRPVSICFDRSTWILPNLRASQRKIQLNPHATVTALARKRAWGNPVDIRRTPVREKKRVQAQKSASLKVERGQTDSPQFYRKCEKYT